jgi:predicted GNAT family acetyltransferase
MSHHGLKIAEVCETDFRDFAAHHAASPEIGSIQTSFDPGVKEQRKRDYEQTIVSLWGCDTLCAVADFYLYQSAIEPTSQVLKLDSVVVGPKLRRRGLASVLVARTIADLIADSGRRIASHLCARRSPRHRAPAAPLAIR